jgi:hypothetical protein
MSAVVRRRTYGPDAAVWFAAAALVFAFTLLAQAPLGNFATNLSHYVAYLLITGQVRVWEAVGLILAVLPWWIPHTGALISALYWWASFVVAFGWEGLGVAIAAISWTGIGALVIAVVGGALIG